MKNPLLHWQRKRMREKSLRTAIDQLIDKTDQISAMHETISGSVGESILDGVEKALGEAFSTREISLGNWALCEREGYRLLLDRTSLVDSTMLDVGAWERAQLDYLVDCVQKYSEKWDVFLDIGAYWGLYSLTVSKLGIPEIIAFEPDRFNRSQLQTQLMLNNMLDRVECRTYALSDRNATLDFFASTSHPTGNRGGVGLVGSAGTNTYKVETRTGDSVLHFTDKTLLFKIDVEGHEASVLKGLEQIISKNKVLMQIEIFDDQLAETLSVAEKLGLKKFHQIHVDHYFANFDLTATPKFSKDLAVLNETPAPTKDFSYTSGERQTATVLDDIRRDHLARYEFADKILPQGIRVLDAFCGNGYGAAILASGRTVLGIDGSQAAIDVANAHFSSTGAQFDAQVYPFSLDATFDAVVSFESVEHVADYRGFLRFLVLRTKPGGTVLFSTPNQDRLPFDPQVMIHHVRHFTYDEAVELARDVGLEIVQQFGQDTYTVVDGKQAGLLDPSRMELIDGYPGQFNVFVARRVV